jgi:hypothetical protein
MSNGIARALLERCKRNGNGPTMGVQCLHALPLPLHGNGQKYTTASSRDWLGWASRGPEKFRNENVMLENPIVLLFAA